MAITVTFDFPRAENLQRGSSQRGIDLILDLDQGVQHHRTALIHIDLVGVETRVLATVRVITIDDETANIVRPIGRRKGLALANF